ncbi:11189_t:CDS:2 [Entrophospora sp. SA101]|nr:4388_t:CDS:2 [Entrophospora sp. SA101]CAJ0632122.1 11189_t:CDS:2 [Entrophospora sp. SA101]CAJ0858435.1 6848_t:CDS:2 [Entrophospora sp. SA101]
MSSSNKNSKKKTTSTFITKRESSEYLAVDPSDQDNKKKNGVRRPQYIEFEEASSVLVDNAPVDSHEILDTLSNLKMNFFLPNTISHLQPYDARIIQAQYKKLLVHDRIEAYETVQVLEKPVALVTIYDVICFTKKACNVNSNKNFWKHTGILLENLEFLNNVEEENHEIQDSLLAGEHLIMEDENIDLAKFFLQIP